PRGIAGLGYTMQRPTEDRFLVSRKELEDKLAVLLGGRAAERLVFEDVSSGAADEREKATAIARNMVTRFGMDETIGNVAYAESPRLLGMLTRHRRMEALRRPGAGGLFLPSHGHDHHRARRVLQNALRHASEQHV